MVLWWSGWIVMANELYRDALIRAAKKKLENLALEAERV